MVSADGEAPLLPVRAPGTSLGRVEGEATDEEDDEEDESDPVAVVRVREMIPDEVEDDDDEDGVEDEDEREEEEGGEGESFLKNWETPDMTSPKRL